jgi:hypothetical protein
MDHEEKNCPICNKKMSVENKIKYIDYKCVTDEHYYGVRIVEDTFTNELRPLKVKIRLGDDKVKSFLLKINYDEGFSEVWTRSGKTESANRSRIEKVFTPDFSNMDKLLNKIKTYIVFS